MQFYFFFSLFNYLLVLKKNSIDLSCRCLVSYDYTRKEEIKIAVKLIDVAQKAGVSKSTVSQYLNGRYQYMSETTKNKIKKVIEELDYQPNAVARSLKIKKTNTIGVIVSDILSPFFAQVVRGIESFALKRGYNVILCNTDRNPKKELEYIKMLRNKQVDGILLSYSGVNKDFSPGDTPLVILDKDVSNLNFPTVVSENKKGVYKAIGHFFNLGYKDIGVISPEIKDIPSRLVRLEGYKEALKDHSLKYDEKKIFFFDDGYDYESQMEELFKKRKIPRAIFSFNYKMTSSFLKYCKSSSIRIPEDVALIGFDDIPYAELLPVPVTVVTEKDYEIGYEASKILFDLIEGKTDNSSGIRKQFSCDLIVRDSCGSKL